MNWIGHSVRDFDLKWQEDTFIDLQFKDMYQGYSISSVQDDLRHFLNNLH